MEGYAASRRRNTLETAGFDLNFSSGLEPCQPREKPCGSRSLRVTIGGYRLYR